MNRNDAPTARDEWLGELLRELDVPEHRPEFHRELRRRLAAESDAAGRRARRRWGLPVGAVAAAGAAIAVVAIGVPRTHRTPGVAGPQPASAAVVKAQLRHALNTLRNLSGVLVASGPAQGTTSRWRFWIDAAGDLRLDGPTAGDVSTYDASSGVVRSAQHSASIGGPKLFYAERTGVAPGPPDQGPPTWLLPDDFAAYVRAALSAGDPRVREVTFEGRPAWQLEVTTVPNSIAPELSGDAFQITVDEQTGLPVRVLERKHGALLRELRIEQVTANTTLAADTFALAFPAGAEVMRSDDGFDRVSLADAATVVGYQPLVPAWVPAGYELAQADVARDSAPTGKEGGNPPSRMVVSLSYRRGLDQFLVTMRLRGTGTWTDPLASPEGFVDHPQVVTLASGALAGAAAQLVVSPNTTPHLWAQTDRLVVTVGGDLSRGELVKIAGSLG